jgi:2-dehydro-3-deoxy-L-rhamnonate dehydrogenase (NAD+)
LEWALVARLKGQTAIVTGAARGIGLGIAKRLAQDGCRVVIWDVDLRPFDAETAGFTPLVLDTVDVTDPAAVELAFARVVELAGSVEILVNNAGINGPVMPSWEYSAADFKRVLDIDLTGVWHGMRAAIPHMRARKYGRIVTVASIAGKEGVPGIAPYSAAKAGVIGLSKAIAKEVVQDGITVNCIAPALTETDLFKEMTAEHIANMKAKIPMGRPLQIAEIGHMVAWIASPECSFTTGFAFDLTGGRATY